MAVSGCKGEFMVSICEFLEVQNTRVLQFIHELEATNNP